VRIIAGRWAGTTLTSPGGRIRPTAEAIRDAMLTGIEPDLPGARILDLFAGTGALGLEALSRGAGTADLVENGPEALHSLKANVATLRARRQVRIFKRDAVLFVERLEPDSYDVTFADPPYGSRKADRIINYWLEVPFSRILVVEHSVDHELPGSGRTRRFGETAVTLFRQTAIGGGYR